MEFTKDMLRTGMRVVHRNGKVGIILKDIDVIALENGYNNVESYSDRIIVHSYDESWDIMKVYGGYQNNRKVLDFNELGQLVWERKEETEQQKRIRELQETIKKAQYQLEELKESC